MGFPDGSVRKESACNVGDLYSIPGFGRYPGSGYGNLLQYSCWRIPMDRGVWQSTVQGGPRELDTPKWLSIQINVHKILNNILQNESLNYMLILMSILADVLCNNIYILKIIKLKELIRNVTWSSPWMFNRHLTESSNEFWQKHSIKWLD